MEQSHKKGLVDQPPDRDDRIVLCTIFPIWSSDGLHSGIDLFQEGAINGVRGGQCRIVFEIIKEKTIIVIKKRGLPSEKRPYALPPM